MALLDGDDVYEPRRLELLGEMAGLRPDLDILASDAFVQVGNEIVRRIYEGSWTFDVLNQRRAILQRNFIVGHAAVRREQLLQAGGFDPDMRTVADWDLWIRMILDGSLAGFVQEPLSRWRIREGSLSTFRVDLFAGSVRALERAAERDDLTADDRQTLETSLRSWRRDHALTEARQELVEARPGSRRKLLHVGMQPGLPLMTRAKVLASAVAPGIAGRSLRRQHERYWIGGGGDRVPRGETS